MTPEDLVDRVAITLSMADPDARGLPEGVTMEEFYRRLARPVIAVVLEEAAKGLEGWGDIYGRNAAAAIRALKGNA